MLNQRTEDGRPLRILTVVDEFTRVALAARAARSFPAGDVIEVIADLMLIHGVPEHIRSDNGPEFTARANQAMAIGKPGQDLLHQARRPLGERLC